MNKTLIVVLTLVGTLACHGALPADGALSANALQPTGAPVGIPLRAGIPMVYKRYGTLGASSSWQAQRSTTVVVQNAAAVDDAPAICFYWSVPEGTPVSAQGREQCYGLPPIRPGASYPLDLDTLAEIPPGFAGSARLYSSGLVTAVATHAFADTNNFLAISMANAITPAAAGGNAYIPTYYSDAAGDERTHAVSALFAQNLDAVENTVTVEFFPVGSSSSARTATFQLAPGRSALLNAPDHFSRFNGSAVVTATRADRSRGVVAAHVFELAQGSEANTVYNLAKAYVAFAHGSSTLSMPTALCKAFGSSVAPAQSTAYAIQNVSPRTAHVAVTFTPGGVVRGLQIAPGAKGSLQTCDAVGAGFTGGATIQSDMSIVAVGKAFADGQPAGTGTLTAFEGVEQGGSSLSIPYVRWAGDLDYFFANGVRSNIAVQNMGRSVAKGVVANYFTPAGEAATVDLGDIAPGEKVNTSPASAANRDAIVTQGLGSVEIVGKAGSELSALVRVQRRRRNAVYAAAISEDYMAAKQKQEYRCVCELTIPTGGQLPAFEQYVRRRDRLSVLALCPDTTDLLGRPKLVAEVAVEDCGACYDVCRPKVAGHYYQYVDTIPSYGDPPGMSSPEWLQNVVKDAVDIVEQDPCKTFDAPFGYQVLSCTAE